MQKASGHTGLGEDWRVAAMFWSKVAVTPGGRNSCWEWQGSRTAGGYGNTGGHGYPHSLAHRVAWELARGPIPDGLWALHHCDNPPCCNPDHLYLGVHAENIRDRVTRDRTAAGEHHGSRTTPEATPRGDGHSNAKLTAADVRTIRALRGQVSEYQLAERFGVSRSTIGHVMQGTTWQHVT